MALAHNMQIRSLNAIYIQATSISDPKDIADFFVFCQIWYEMLHHHHELEEKFLFPEFEKQLNQPGIMSVSIEQHRAFHDPLEVWARRCYNTTPDQYNGNEWRQLIDDFAKPLMVHLRDEIDALEALIPFDPDCVVTDKLWKELEAMAKNEADSVCLPTNPA
jgi:hemerythrin-like domain-containing protein